MPTEPQEPQLPPPQEPQEPQETKKSAKKENGNLTAMISLRCTPEQKQQWDAWTARVMKKNGFTTTREMFFNSKTGLLASIKKLFGFSEFK